MFAKKRLRRKKSETKKASKPIAEKKMV